MSQSLNVIVVCPLQSPPIKEEPKVTKKAVAQDTVPEIIDSGPMCITDLFQDKYLAYFNPI